MTLPFKPENMDVSPFRLEILKKNIKHIYFRVYPSQKKIQVSVPLHLTQGEWERAVLSKKNWLLKQINKPRQARVSGQHEIFTHEGVLFKGSRFPVKICSTDHRCDIVALQKEAVTLFLKSPYPNEKVMAILERWLREQLTLEIGNLVKKWEPVLSVKVLEYRIRKMKTRWGSCNITAARIWLNRTLIHMPVQYLEYVVVHEMVHLLEKRHNSRFKAFMDSFVPDWRQLKDQMNSLSLDLFDI